MKGKSGREKRIRKMRTDAHPTPLPGPSAEQVKDREADAGAIERYARALIEYSFDLILLVNREGEIQYASPSADRMLGYDPREVLGASIFDFVHPDDRKAALDLFYVQIERSGFSPSLIVRVRHRDGSWRHLEAVANNLLDDPEVRAVSISARDVTEHMNLEDDLRRSEEYFRYITENTYDIISVIDASGILQYISPSIKSIAGFDPEELIGKSAFANIHPEDLEATLKIFGDGVSDSAPSDRATFRWLHKDGSWHIYEAVGINALENPSIQGVIVNARDITEKKTLEDELQRSEEYFRSLTEGTSDIITVLDAEGTILYVSPSMERVAGYKQEEIVGKGLLEFAHPDDIQNSREPLINVLKSKGETRYAEIRIRHADGSWHYYEAAATNLLDNPIVRGIVVHTREMTERKEWEEALRASEERYRLVYDFTGEAIYTYDTDFVLIGVNKKACELIGFDESEILGRNMLELNILHPDDYERTLRDIQGLFNGEIVNDELRFIRKDGSVAIGDVTGAPLYNKDGEVIAFTNVARDITESKKAEVRLEKFNQCLLGLGPDPLENVKNIVLTGIDILEGHDLFYARLDKGRLSFFPYPRSSLDFTIAEDPERYICYGLINSGGESPLNIEDLASAECERDPLVVDGGFRSLLAFPARLPGKTVGSLCLFSGEASPFTQEEMNLMGMLSRALTIEEERLAHEESIRHFVDIASHELRTPLSIIKGYAEAFQFGDLMDLNDYQLEKIRIVNAKADKMSKTINDLLDLSRIERGQFTVEKQAAELEPLISSAVRQMKEKGIENEFEVIAAEGLGRLQVDQDKLVDALLILLDNAVHYSPAASTVNIEVGPSQEGVLFSIKDRGAGVPEKDRESIFERFYQLEDSRHHSASGMGLGLYIAREIVQSHGGRIWYEPREGGGSVFCFLIPS